MNTSLRYFHTVKVVTAKHITETSLTSSVFNVQVRLATYWLLGSCRRCSLSTMLVYYCFYRLSRKFYGFMVIRDIIQKQCVLIVHIAQEHVWDVCRVLGHV